MPATLGATTTVTNMWEDDNIEHAQSSGLLMMYFYHFWCPKMKPWSALMAHLGLLLTFVTLGCSGVMCPDKCVCDDQSLKHDCSDGDLEGIPIFFNPETKVLKVRCF